MKHRIMAKEGMAMEFALAVILQAALLRITFLGH
jgi:hypothetical protein